MTQTVLVVDDEAHIREVVTFALQKAGYRVVEAADGDDALAAFARARPDLVVLDIVMPTLDGTEVCRRLRAEHQTPIVFLSSRDEEIDRVLGLELGGDDYVTKPFSPRELIARVRAVLRRSTVAQEVGEQGNPVVEHGRLRLDVERFQAHWADVEIVLTATEFGVLHALIRAPGKVFSRQELIGRAYRDPVRVADRTVDSHVRRVRRKFADAGGDPIETVHGIGYRLGPC